ncbi:pyridoxamine 5'-phosphate oxidase family protein [Paenibacillus koleovorans]|uniref:pyridoxamine 5'-phosphate oxidase family protein n=1 Tax=Paenibacillus koleovorans TaxID=121608 RepID=UPI000FD8C1D5|nr:pyridoxamine 5'-phosphate oxidase family protein [Paenibacillus koleovorans]
MAETVTALSEPLMNHFQKQKLALLGTIDADTGAPSQNAISWTYAVAPDCVRFAVDQRSRIVANLRGNPSATLTVFAEGSVFAVSGRAAVAEEPLEGVPFKLACVDLTVEAVRDVMYYGSRIAAEPEVEKSYDKRAAAKLDNQVLDAMKKA